MQPENYEHPSAKYLIDLYLKLTKDFDEINNNKENFKIESDGQYFLRLVNLNDMRKKIIKLIIINNLLDANVRSNLSNNTEITKIKEIEYDTEERKEVGEIVKFIKENMPKIVFDHANDNDDVGNNKFISNDKKEIYDLILDMQNRGRDEISEQFYNNFLAFEATANLNKDILSEELWGKIKSVPEPIISFKYIMMSPNEILLRDLMARIYDVIKGHYAVRLDAQRDVKRNPDFKIGNEVRWM